MPTAAQLRACCQTAPSYYVNQCWVIKSVLWHSHESDFNKTCSWTTTSDKFAPFCDLLCFVMAMCWTIWCTFFIITSLQWRQMGTMVSLITSLAIVYSSIYSGADQRKYQSFASLAFVRGIHRDIAFNNVFSVLCDLVLRESQNIVLYLTTINPATLICYRMVPYLEKNMGFWCLANEVY